MEYWLYKDTNRAFMLSKTKYTEEEYNKITKICKPITVTEFVIINMVNKYGVDTQLDVAIEEMAELIKELIKYKRSKVHSREKNNESEKKVLEEISDVMFMFEYIKYIFSLTDESIKEEVAKKAIRTMGRYL